MKLFTGDLREEMAAELRANLEKIINRKQKDPDYYILCHVKWADEGILNTRLVILPQLPPKMLSTICWFVDNRRGQLWRMWSLPMDIPIGHIDLMDGPPKTIEETLEEAQEVPIFH